METTITQIIGDGCNMDDGGTHTQNVLAALSKFDEESSSSIMRLLIA